MAIRALIFDLDFTLWHLGAPFAEATSPAVLLGDKGLERLIRSHQLSRIAAVMSRSDGVSARHSAPAAEAIVGELDRLWRTFMVSSDQKEIDAPALLRESLVASGLAAPGERANEIWEASYVPYPDFPLELYGDTLPTLEQAKRLGLKTAVLTNSPWLARVRRPDLDALGLGSFVDAFFASADTGYRKPHPLAFERALAAIGAEPAEAIMIGDDLAADVVGARHAGITGVWKRNKQSGEQPAEADFVIDDLAELLDLPLF